MHQCIVFEQILIINTDANRLMNGLITNYKNMSASSLVKSFFANLYRHQELYNESMHRLEEYLLPRNETEAINEGVAD